jgi:1-deoxy-D-xylulose-5-phosphate reductoisomerase
MEKKRIAILASTGSIATQALDVISEHPAHFAVEILTAQSRVDLLICQAIEFIPNAVVIGDDTHYEKVKEALKDYPIKVFAGQAAISQVVESESVDLVLNALVGFAGLEPTLKGIRARKDIALANKETLVVAGDLIITEALKNNVSILPVDSEHSAIFQCLVGEDPATVEKLILTASGGPFRGKKKEHLKDATKEAALRHPKWKMGNKITIDSASLMNKGLEVIEAHWLFGIDPKKIDVVIHPQSVIHSMVQFIDGSIKAQMGIPDMKLPIHFALSYPQRMISAFPRFNFSEHPELTFEIPDHEVFRNLGLAYEALERMGNMPCILNGANEVAVQAFLEDRISFLNMSSLIEKCMHSVTFVRNPGYDEYIETDREARMKAWEFVKAAR